MLEHARIHPKFLHSNATSHKWAFGGEFLTCRQMDYLKFSFFFVSSGQPGKFSFICGIVEVEWLLFICNFISGYRMRDITRNTRICFVDNL